MSLGTLTFERKELSENEMIYGLTILKFVEKIGIYITHFNKLVSHAHIRYILISIKFIKCIW